MICPICKKELDKTILHNTEVHFCSSCLGIWFERDQLRQAKDAKDEDLNWLDIDLWKDKKKFKISPGQISCPSCGTPFYEVNYGDSDIKIDLCNVCHGIWLDRGEFKKIIDYLKSRADYEVFDNYAKNLLKETMEVFMGPGTLKDEISDFLTILKLLNYKIVMQHPVLSKLISILPK